MRNYSDDVVVVANVDVEGFDGNFFYERDVMFFDSERDARDTLVMEARRAGGRCWMGYDEALELINTSLGLGARITTRGDLLKGQVHDEENNCANDAWWSSVELRQLALAMLVVADRVDATDQAWTLRNQIQEKRPHAAASPKRGGHEPL